MISIANPATISVRVCIALVFTFSLGVSAQSQGQEDVFVIEGGTVIDGTGSGPQEGWSIVIGDGRIVELGPSQQIRRPDNATVVDATGKFIIPGLTDSHVHYYGYEAELFLAHGVTSVLLLGGVYEWEIAQRDAIARGEMIGPRIFTAGNPLGGPISTPPQGTPSTGPSTGLASLPHSISVHNSREEAISATRRLVEQEVDFIKFQAEITPQLAKVISDEAHRAGKLVFAHLGSYFDAGEAAEAGVDWIMHADLATEAELYAVAEAGVRIMPTMTFLFEALEVGKEKGRSDAELDIIKRNADNAVTVLQTARSLGVQVMSGTDTGNSPVMPYGLLHANEAEIMVKYGGYSPMEAIVACTRVRTEIS